MPNFEFCIAACQVLLYSFKQGWKFFWQSLHLPEAKSDCFETCLFWFWFLAPLRAGLDWSLLRGSSGWLWSVHFRKSLLNAPVCSERPLHAGWWEFKCIPMYTMYTLGIVLLVVSWQLFFLWKFHSVRSGDTLPFARTRYYLAKSSRGCLSVFQKPCLCVALLSLVFSQILSSSCSPNSSLCLHTLYKPLSLLFSFLFFPFFSFFSKAKIIKPNCKV